MSSAEELLRQGCRQGRCDLVRSVLDDARKNNAESLVRSTLVLNVSPMVLACECGHLDVVRLLVEEYGFDVDDTTSPAERLRVPIAVAAFSGQVKVVQFLLDRHAKVDAANTYLFGGTALFGACLRGRFEIVQMLVEQGGANISGAAAGNGATPLMKASQYGHMDIVVYLLQKWRQNHADADEAVEQFVSTFSRFEGTALSLAASNGHRNVMRVLLDNGAGRNDAHVTMAMNRAKSCDTLRMLLDETGGRLKPGHGAFVVAVVAHRDEKLAKMILELMEDVEKLDDPDESGAFKSACRMGMVDLVKLYMEKLATIGKDVEFGRRQAPALAVACAHPDSHISMALVQLLLSKQVNVTAVHRNRTVLMAALAGFFNAGASAESRIAIMRLLLNDGHVNVNHRVQSPFLALNERDYDDHDESGSELDEDEEVNVRSWNVLDYLLVRIFMTLNAGEEDKASSMAVLLNFILSTGASFLTSDQTSVILALEAIRRLEIILLADDLPQNGQNLLSQVLAARQTSASLTGLLDVDKAISEYEIFGPIDIDVDSIKQLFDGEFPMQLQKCCRISILKQMDQATGNGHENGSISRMSREQAIDGLAREHRLPHMLIDFLKFQSFV